MGRAWVRGYNGRGLGTRLAHYRCHLTFHPADRAVHNETRTQTKWTQLPLSGRGWRLKAVCELIPLLQYWTGVWFTCVLSSLNKRLHNILLSKVFVVCGEGTFLRVCISRYRFSNFVYLCACILSEFIHCLRECSQLKHWKFYPVSQQIVSPVRISMRINIDINYGINSVHFNDLAFLCD